MYGDFVEVLFTVLWKVQLRLGSNPRLVLVTRVLVEHPCSGSWSVREVP